MYAQIKPDCMIPKWAATKNQKKLPIWNSWWCRSRNWSGISCKQCQLHSAAHVTRGKKSSVQQYCVERETCTIYWGELKNQKKNKHLTKNLQTLRDTERQKRRSEQRENSAREMEQVLSRELVCSVAKPFCNKVVGGGTWTLQPHKTLLEKGRN